MRWHDRRVTRDNKRHGFGGTGKRQVPKTFDARVLLEYFDPDTDDVAIAAALGCNRSSVNKWRNDRAYMIGAYRADRMAIRIGLHPSLVWGDQWWQLESTAIDL